MSAEPTSNPVPSVTLTVVSGRPGTGKTTLARALARRLRSCCLRVDAAETALARTTVPVGVEGYAVIHELAVSNLLLGIDVVVDAVSPVPEARAGWREAAARGGARQLQVETWIPDPSEHRRRVERRTADIPGHHVPSWAQVESQPWIPWDERRDGPRTLIETRHTARQGPRSDVPAEVAGSTDLALGAACPSHHTKSLAAACGPGAPSSALPA